MRLAIIVPVYGEYEITTSLVVDIYRELQGDLTDLYIVDNEGHYARFSNEVVLRPGSNLHWAGGSNLGIETARHIDMYNAFVVLNNDTELSPDFFRGISEALEAHPEVGLLSPCYDDNSPLLWPSSGFRGPAIEYKPNPLERRVGFVDGPGWVITMDLWKAIGPIDTERFDRHGWGTTRDFAIRAKKAGFQIAVTERAYFNHFRAHTATKMTEHYEIRAALGMLKSLKAAYGEEWTKVHDEGTCFKQNELIPLIAEQGRQRYGDKIQQ